MNNLKDKISRMDILNSVKKKVGGSLKMKLLLGFILIGVLLGVVSIVSNLILSTSLDKLDQMIQATVLANRIPINIDKISAENGFLESYFVSHDKIILQKISDTLNQANSDIGQLKKYVKQKDASNKIERITSIYITLLENTNKAITAIDNSKTKETIDARTATRRTNQIFALAINELIASELLLQESEKADLQKKATSTRTVVIILIIAIDAISIFLALIFTNSIAETIRKLADYAHDIANGNLQVKKLKLKTNDDIAILANSFNTMGENLRQLISNINQSSLSVFNSAELLKAGSEQSTKAIDQIASNMIQVTHGANDQAERSSETVEVVNQLLNRNEMVSGYIHEIMNASAKATNIAQIGNGKMENLIEQIGVITKKIVETQFVVEVFNQRSNEIKKILNTITNIATQSNLLALNAAIEAAKAGEHGRGFAVVADEVKKLAIGSTKSATEITAVLNEIQNQSNRVTKMMAEGVEEAKEGTNMAGEARISFGALVDTSNVVDGQVREITGEIEKMVLDIRKVETMSNGIFEIARKFSSGSEEVAAAVEEEMANLEEITSSASILTDMAISLQAMVSKFTL